MPIVFDQVQVLSAGETDNFAADMSKLLDSGETLTGTPTITEAGRFTGYDANGVAEYSASADLTITNKAYNSGEITVNGRPVETGKGVQCQVSGQLAGYTYGLRITVTTTSTPTRTLKRDALFEVK